MQISKKRKCMVALSLITFVTAFVIVGLVGIQTNHHNDEISPSSSALTNVTDQSERSEENENTTSLKVDLGEVTDATIVDESSKNDEPNEEETMTKSLDEHSSSAKIDNDEIDKVTHDIADIQTSTAISTSKEFESPKDDVNGSKVEAEISQGLATVGLKSTNLSETQLSNSEQKEISEDHFLQDSKTPTPLTTESNKPSEGQIIQHEGSMEDTKTEEIELKEEPTTIKFAEIIANATPSLVTIMTDLPTDETKEGITQNEPTVESIEEASITSIANKSASAPPFVSVTDESIIAGDKTIFSNEEGHTGSTNQQESTPSEETKSTHSSTTETHLSIETSTALLEHLHETGDHDAQSDNDNMSEHSKENESVVETGGNLNESEKNLTGVRIGSDMGLGTSTRTSIEQEKSEKEINETVESTTNGSDIGLTTDVSIPSGSESDKLAINDSHINSTDENENLSSLTIANEKLDVSTKASTGEEIVNSESPTEDGHESEPTTELNEPFDATKELKETSINTNDNKSLLVDEQHEKPENTSEEKVSQEIDTSRTKKIPFSLKFPDIEYRPEFLDSSSAQFHKFQREIGDELRSILRSVLGENFIDFEIVNLHQGSVVLEGNILARQEILDPLEVGERIQQALKANNAKLGGNSVDVKSVVVDKMSTGSTSQTFFGLSSDHNMTYIIVGAVVLGFLIIIFIIFIVITVNKRKSRSLKLRTGQEIAMVENGGRRTHTNGISNNVNNGVSLVGYADGEQAGKHSTTQSGSQFSRPNAFHS